ncbi:HIRAN domain-containing protein [Nonomuraea sp. B19D2]|uniref:HIRAN domain-containing protein n=1 Tax=Nonomuraea sp. B19D2 TaxID=3159561 RepID=UPI0032D9DDFF
MDMPGFRPLLGFGDLERRYESATLFPLFNQRLMSPRRPDYDAYLTVLGLPDGSPPLAVLGRSGGRRAGDAIFLVPEPQVDENGRTCTFFFVHGLRHVEGAESRISMLREGDALELRDDPTNPVNRQALLVTREGGELGWVPDLLLDYVHHVRDTGDIAIRVAQVNGADAPPNLRLRVRLDGSVPCGYVPFRGEEWATF